MRQDNMKQVCICTLSKEKVERDAAATFSLMHDAKIS